MRIDADAADLMHHRFTNAAIKVRYAKRSAAANTSSIHRETAMPDTTGDHRSATLKPRSIADLDVPAAQVAAEAVLIEAESRTQSLSDRIAYALDRRLVTHPEAPVSTDATYSGWADAVAAMAAKNKPLGSAA